jgi:hypothetical protein
VRRVSSTLLYLTTITILLEISDFKIFVPWYSPVRYYFISSRSKYLRRFYVFSYSQSLFFIRNRPCLTLA